MMAVHPNPNFSNFNEGRRMTASDELLQRAKRAMRRHGIIGMVPKAATYLMHVASRLRPSVRAQLEDRRARAAAFDQQFGVNTDGVIYQTELRVNHPNQLHAVRYEASDPQFFRNAIKALPIDFQNFVFIDFGSGKGRAILLATEFPFKKIVGVEFSEDLHSIAEQNIRSFRSNISRCKHIQSVCMDALDYSLPNEPLVCYFGNPFGDPVMTEVLAMIEQSMSRAPREIFIVYYNARSRHLFDRSACFRRLSEIGPVLIWRGAAR